MTAPRPGSRPAAAARPLPTWQIWLWPALLVAIGAAMWLMPWRGWVGPLRLWVADQGVMGWLVFVAVYAGVVILPLPAAAMSVAAGLAFGWWGFPLSMLGSILGAVPPWWATRRFLRAPVMRRLRGPRVEAADRAVRDNAWLFVSLLRLTPILPFTLQNYLLGLTDVRFGPYVGATLLGLAPGTLAMVWIGEMGGLASVGADRAKLALAGAGLVAFGILVLWMIRVAMVQLRRAGFDDADR